MGDVRTTREVLDAHLTARQDGDLERDLAENYAPDGRIAVQTIHYSTNR